MIELAQNIRDTGQLFIEFRDPELLQIADRDPRALPPVMERREHQKIAGDRRGGKEQVQIVTHRARLGPESHLAHRHAPAFQPAIGLQPELSTAVFQRLNKDCARLKFVDDHVLELEPRTARHAVIGIT